MKSLRIRKIITALIVITWVPSSFASPSSVARSSSAASSSSYIYYYASPSSAETQLSILDRDGKNEINLNFITSSNGQKLVTFEYCQDGSCRPLGLEKGYSLEILKKSSEPWKKLSNEYWGIYKEKVSHEISQIQLDTGRFLVNMVGLVAGVTMIFTSSVLLALITAGITITAVWLVALSHLVYWDSPSKKALLRSVMPRAERILEIIDSGEALQIVVEGNAIREIVTEIEEALKEFDSKTLVPLPRD